MTFIFIFIFILERSISWDRMKETFRCPDPVFLDVGIVSWQRLQV